MNTDIPGKIHLLDDDTINKIAAGEVVERPASVVKELVENSIDSGAKNIKIDIGSDSHEIFRIRVSDDGCGMDRDSAVLSVRRHATSKLSSAGDLITIGTMGFRGEALASIASVSRFTLITKENTRDSIQGTKIVIEGGKDREVSETGAPSGTSVLVENLFFNTPARKKFLKSRQTEFSHILKSTEQIALANPSVSVLLTHNGKDKLFSGTSGDFKEKIGHIYGSESVNDLIEIKKTFPFMKVDGFCAKPSVNSSTQQSVHISVNNRPISSVPLSRAIKEGYGTLLPKNRYPVAYLNLIIDRNIVDVNVHPTKREVRFSRETEIRSALRESVSEALKGESLIYKKNPSVFSFENRTSYGTKDNEKKHNNSESGKPSDQDFDKYGYFPSGMKEELNSAQEKETSGVRSQKPDLFSSYLKKEQEPVYVRDSSVVKSRDSGIFSSCTTEEQRSSAVSEAYGKIISRDPGQKKSPFAGFIDTSPDKDQRYHPKFSATDRQLRLTENFSYKYNGESRFPDMKIAGQFNSSYIVAFMSGSEGEELVLIDQHAAHERIIYDQIQANKMSGKNSQELLVPVILNLRASESMILISGLKELEEEGFKIEEFGRDSFAIRSVPLVLGKRIGTEIIKDIISDIMDDGTSTFEERKEKIASTVSCKAAIKAGTELSFEQMKKLVKQLSATENPYTCPHGRPAIITISSKKLSKMFLRT
ncbi:DNA mismatch repair endonuclease MutL [Methanoplanus limicola]|uniref:DNA mismatch repair protein MutL n=1 Tax=Methanoplanus limicola DSM 2279 TaxID=937775 RepID=H1YWF6_9EURY|nr:DNA mismatch repair endonuclease MutL [Methanoplanus limicola]EHQ35758.1 DNA mismatch repair protein MutL [Methanoplanus limicola DSM 2279]